MSRLIGDYQVMQPDDVPPIARPTSAGAWRYFTEEWHSRTAPGTSYFKVWAEMHKGGTLYVVEFSDEPGERIPLNRYGYNAEYGLFDKQAFPDLEDDGDDGEGE